MTVEQKSILVQITNNMMNWKTSQRFQEPLTYHHRYFAADIDGYMVKKEPMDLRVLKQKLIEGDYISLQEYKRDFRLIIHIALQLHEPDSQIAKDAQSLNAKFEEELTKMSLTNMEDPEYKIKSKSSIPASPGRGLGGDPPRRTTGRRPPAAKLDD